MTNQSVASRLAAISVLVGIVLVPFMLLGPLLAGSWIADTKTIDTKQELLSRLRAEAAAEPLWKARIARIEADGIGSAGLVTANTSPAATAALQHDIRQLAAASGGEVHSAQPGNAVLEEGLERIDAGFDLTLGSEALPSFLSALEKHDPTILVDKMQLTASPRPNKPAELALHLRVHAYRRPS